VLEGIAYFESSGGFFWGWGSVSTFLRRHNRCSFYLLLAFRLSKPPSSESILPLPSAAVLPSTVCLPMCSSFWSTIFLSLWLFSVPVHLIWGDSKVQPFLFFSRVEYTALAVSPLLFRRQFLHYPILLSTQHSVGRGSLHPSPEDYPRFLSHSQPLHHLVPPT